MHKVLYSIIIPVYNAELKLEKSLKSVLNQDQSLLELLLIDGNSNDNTVRIIQEYQAKNPTKIKFISEPDQGVFDAMNKGIALATGEYLYFLGAGDTLKPGILKLVKEKLRYQSELLYGGIFLEELNKIDYHQQIDQLHLCFSCINHQAIFYHHSIFEMVGKYNIKYQPGADLDLNIKCFAEPKIATRLIEIIIANYEGGGISSKNNYHHYRKDQDQIIRHHFGTDLYYLYKNRYRDYQDFKRTAHGNQPPDWHFLYVDFQSWRIDAGINPPATKTLQSKSPYPGTRLAVCSAVSNNSEQLVKVQAGSIEGEQVGLAARTGNFYGSRSGYYLALLNGNKLVLRSWLAGQTVHWLETVFQWKARQWYWLKLRCQADHLLLGKAWPDGDPEPVGWMLQGHCHQYIGGSYQGIIANAPGTIAAKIYAWKII